MHEFDDLKQDRGLLIAYRIALCITPFVFFDLTGLEPTSSLFTLFYTAVIAVSAIDTCSQISILCTNPRYPRSSRIVRILKLAEFLALSPTLLPLVALDWITPSSEYKRFVHHFLISPEGLFLITVLNSITVSLILDHSLLSPHTFFQQPFIQTAFPVLYLSAVQIVGDISRDLDTI